VIFRQGVAAKIGQYFHRLVGDGEGWSEKKKWSRFTFSERGDILVESLLISTFTGNGLFATLATLPAW
jgi:hypothetical protein